MILVDMLGGTIKQDRDIRLRGIEALISGQFFDLPGNRENRKI